MEQTRAFIHGLESSGRGTKGVFFHQRYPQMIIEDYFGSFSERMDRLAEVLADKNRLILVGSSYGGLMAAVYACLHEERVERLVLLAPALHVPEFRQCRNFPLRTPVAIFHGTHDEVVPLPAVRDIARCCFLSHTFTELEDDHSLHKTFEQLDWDTLLGFTR